MAEHGLYIQMFSVHGLLRGEAMELGRDADTGGQINYVVELARHLAQQEGVGQVDLFTRLLVDRKVSEDYGQTMENLADNCRIVRIQCGGRKYMRKELLWPHLDEFVDRTIKFNKRQGRLPDVLHGHYADAGYVAMQLSRIFGIPFVFTGHSLGRVKKKKLRHDGMKAADINKKFKIDKRIEVEEEILKFADLIVASTHQEVRQQYGEYRYDHRPAFKVLPPGLDIAKFYPYYHDMLNEGEKSEEQIYAKASLLTELNRFFSNPEKPLLLALCRPDKRKNITGLVQVFGEDRDLQAMANLAVFAGIRKDIEAMEDNERDVLTNMLLLMDKYDLYGKMAIPKKHDFEQEVPELYRIAAEKQGVFINPALTEPFGLTLLEASASGVPIVATEDGGPKDIVANCQNGILVDPTDSRQIGAALKKIVADEELWKTYSKNGILNVRKYYTWENHAQVYLTEIKPLADTNRRNGMGPIKPKDAIGRRLNRLNHFIVSDIDHTLIGADNSGLAPLKELLHAQRDQIGFAVATGRTVESATNYLRKHEAPDPDIIVSSVGTEIYYGPQCQYGQGWHSHIANKWNRNKITKLLRGFDFLEYQEEETQRVHKVSYYMDPGKDRLAMIHDRLLGHKCRYTLIYSHDRYLDILPARASKGKALRYLSYKWEIPLANFLVCGDSGNDEEMLKGEPLAVVVGNYSPELEKLKGRRNTYFAQQPYSQGILEGLKHYQFIRKAKGPVL